MGDDRIRRWFFALDADVFVAGLGEGGSQVEIFDVDGESLLFVGDCRV